MELVVQRLEASVVLMRFPLAELADAFVDSITGRPVQDSSVRYRTVNQISRNSFLSTPSDRNGDKQLLANVV